MNERIEKFKFHRQLRKIDWDSVIKDEADKVIAEKDAAIAELKEQVHDYADKKAGSEGANQ